MFTNSHQTEGKYVENVVVFQVECDTELAEDDIVIEVLFRNGKWTFSSTTLFYDKSIEKTSEHLVM